jgi:stage V sporulation protein B
MPKQNKKDDFIKQAGILAAAGLICRIIGILYRSPLTIIIGDEGNGYYSAAIYCYTIILLISSYSIPAAVSKVISQRLAAGEYKNAQRIFRGVLLYVFVVGGIASILTYVFADVLVIENAAPVLQVFAPTIFFSGILGVLRGYFQANRTMMQTSVSQIVEQILNAVMSILAAYLLIQTVSDQDTTTQAIYGAAGSAIGTGIGVIAALLFMGFVYILNIGIIKKRLRRDKTPDEQLQPYSEIFKLIFMVITPFILSTFIYNVINFLDQTIYTKVYGAMIGYTQKEIAVYYGIYSAKAMVIVNVPVAFSAAIAASIIPSISGVFAKGDIEGTSKKVVEAIKTTMLLSIPSAAGLFALAKPVTQLLFNQKDSLDLASNLLRVLCISVVFYGLSTLTNAVLQGIGKAGRPVVNAAVALVFQTIILITLLFFTDWNLYCLAIASIAYSLLMCIFNQSSVKHYLGYKQDIIKIYILPIVASTIMGGIAYGIYEAVNFVMNISDGIDNAVGLVFSIPIAAMVYFALIIKLKVVSKEELLNFPKGRILVKVEN